MGWQACGVRVWEETALTDSFDVVWWWVRGAPARRWLRCLLGRG